MIEAMIPKDIRKYESKLIGPLTLRQTICFVISAVLAYVSQHAFKDTNQTVAQYIAFTLAVIPTLFGQVKIYNLPLEKFLMTAASTHLLSPSHRLYKVENKKLFMEVGGDFTPLDKKALKKHKKANKKAAKSNAEYKLYS